MLSTLFPSMFHRRLLLLAGAVLMAAGTLAVQTYRLTVVQGGQFLDIAESRLVEERWTPTVRGRILDRKGRVLASDAAGFDIYADYSVLSGQWAYSSASRETSRAMAERWDTMSPESREAAIESVATEKQRLLAEMWGVLAEILQIELPVIEARRSEILRFVQRTSASVNLRRLESMREERQEERPGAAIDLSLADVSIPIREEHSPHPIARGVDEQTARNVRRLASRYPGLHVLPSGTREYAFQSVTVDVPTATLPRPLRESRDDFVEIEVEGPLTHVVGWMREVFAEDMDDRPKLDPETQAVDPGHYMPGDLIGRTGVESSQEYRLRGDRGRVVRHLDTEEEDVSAPVGGADVSITIDAALQARIMALMDPDVGLARVQPWHSRIGEIHPLPVGTPLYGAATVIEVDTGEILAMVSTPSFSIERVREDPESVWNDRITQRGVNKAIAKPYPPGSIVKPLVLVSAVSEGIHDLSTGIECVGHLIPNNKSMLRCWIYKQTGNTVTHQDVFSRALVAHEAVAVSCNIFFYTIARQLGIERLVDWYEKFGVGEAFGLGVGHEYPGVAGIDFAGNRAGIGEATLMGIGQGPIAWTPVHAADSYATLARGGLRIAPRLIRDDAPRARELGLDSAAVREALLGLREAVSNDQIGSAYDLTFPDGSRERIFSLGELAYYGKTGTAEAPDIVETDEEGNETVLRTGDHSWFVILVGEPGRRPEYAVSVVMEYAGSGGRVSGPIANQIVRALQDEGYL